MSIESEISAIQRENTVYTPDKLRRIMSILLQDPPFTQTVITMSEKVKCISLPMMESDYITRTDYSFRYPEHIYRYTASEEQLLPYQLPRDEESVYYTYVIDVHGIGYGRILDSLEMGVAHQMLVMNEKDPVIIAGEIMIRGNDLLFNFESGTFSKAKNLHKRLDIKQFLITLVTILFQMHHEGERGLDSVTYTDEIILPAQAFTPYELERICKLDPTRVFRTVKRCGKCGLLRDLISNPENNVCLNPIYANELPPSGKMMEHASRAASPKPRAASPKPRAASPKPRAASEPIDITELSEGIIKRASEHVQTLPEYQLSKLYSSKMKKWYWNIDPSDPYTFKAMGKRARSRHRQR
jgi:hypothetical protein